MVTHNVNNFSTTIGKHTLWSCNVRYCRKGLGLHLQLSGNLEICPWSYTSKFKFKWKFESNSQIVHALITSLCGRSLNMKINKWKTKYMHMFVIFAFMTKSYVFFSNSLWTIIKIYAFRILCGTFCACRVEILMACKIFFLMCWLFYFTNIT